MDGTPNGVTIGEEEDLAGKIRFLSTEFSNKCFLFGDVESFPHLHSPSSLKCHIRRSRLRLH